MTQMQTPIVSVIIPTYNRCQFLPRALKSAMAQSLGAIEIIIVDDASNDQTRDVILSIGDQRLRYIRHEQNQGACAARNTGIKAARASLIALLDDDDEWLPQILELEFKKFQEVSSRVGVVYAAAEIYEKTKVIEINKPVDQGDVYKRLLLGTIMASNSALIKKECFEKAGFFDEQLSSCQDWDMWLRIAQFYEFDFINEIGARVYLHGQQISSNYQALIPGRTQMIEKHRQEFSLFPSIYVVHLKRMGKLHALNGSWKQAWAWFAQAIRVQWTEIFKIAAWLILEWPWTVLFSQSKNFKKYKI